MRGCGLWSWKPGAKPEKIDKFAEANESNEFIELDLFICPSDSKSITFSPSSGVDLSGIEPDLEPDELVDLGEPH